MEISTVEERRQSAIEALEDQVRHFQNSHNDHLDFLRKILKKLEEFKGFKKANEKLENTVAELKGELAKRQEQHDLHIQRLTTALLGMDIENKKLQSASLSSFGRVQCLVRVRPSVAAEKSDAHAGLTLFPSELHLDGQKFHADRMFNKKSSTDQIFEYLNPLIQLALAGRNVFIFATGKFWTDIETIKNIN